MKLVFSLITYVSLIFITGASSFLYAQRPNETNEISNYVRINKLVKKTGWGIPNKEELQLNSIDQIEFENYTITVKNLNPKKDFETEFEDYFLKADNSLAIRSFNSKIIGMNSYELKGRIFAYRALYVPIITGPDGSRSTAGMVYRAYYYDENGDGVFETLYTSKQSIDYLPDWVKK